MGRRRWYVLGATVVALTLVAAGCGGGGVDEAGSSPTTVAPSTSTVPASTTTVLTDEQAVLAAYQGYWDTWLAANDPPDPDHPDLDRYYTGRSLDRALESIRNRRSVGQAIRLRPEGQYSHTASVEELTSSWAVVSDCSVDDGLLVDWSSGLVLNDKVVTESLRATLRFQNGQWQVADVERLAEWDGVSGCAA